MEKQVFWALLHSFHPSKGGPHPNEGPRYGDELSGIPMDHFHYAVAGTKIRFTGALAAIRSSRFFPMCDLKPFSNVKM